MGNFFLVKFSLVMQIEKYSKCKFFVDKSSCFKADVLNKEAC